MKSGPISPDSANLISITPPFTLVEEFFEIEGRRDTNQISQIEGRRDTSSWCFSRCLKAFGFLDHSNFLVV
jgi:hypothetical protein